MIGRRVTDFDQLEQPGDYYGPIAGWTDDKLAVFFLLPHPDSSDDTGIHHVTSPPHRFRECPDGSLEIRDSIGAHGAAGVLYAWHGYLDEGHSWRTV